ncbi:MAG: V-type ATP synthase subunit E [bacterium]|jgi:V/A-type H+-transporting ATPase subunit E
MAGAEKIVERILADAKEQAEAIKKEAEEKAALIIKRAEAEVEKMQRQSEAKAKAEAEERRRRILTIAELDGRKAVLAAKEEMLEEAFATALKQLQALDIPSYQAIIRPLLLASSETGSEEVIISPADVERITPEFIAGVNAELRAQGKGQGLTLSEEKRPLPGGGFILRAGGVEINNSFAALLKLQREELEPQVAAILFAGEEGGAKEANLDGRCN